MKGNWSLFSTWVLHCRKQSISFQTIAVNCISSTYSLPCRLHATPARQSRWNISWNRHSRFHRILASTFVFFWDLFNYLESGTIGAFLTALQPYLKKSTVAHAFSVHNLKIGQNSHLYGIQQPDILSFKERRTALPGYSPHSQNQLKQLLHCFRIERSVLLPRQPTRTSVAGSLGLLIALAYNVMSLFSS